MNKIYIATAIAFTSITLVGAQVGGVNQEQGRPTTARPLGTQEGRPQVTTLSGPVGEQIKALNKEMESKIQAIRDEYMAKIKAILEANKVTRPASTTTPPGMMRGEKRGMDEGRKMGVPFMQGTGTRPMMDLEAIKERQSEGQDAISRLRDLFRGFLGR